MDGNLLGLDISTSCTGYSILSPDGTLLHQGCVRFKQKQDHFCRVSELRDIILSHHDRWNIENIFIEQNFQVFRSGFSSAKTLTTLTRFNGMVSYSLFESLGIVPKYINVNSARKGLGIKIIREKECGKSTKEQVLKWASDQLADSEYSWPTKTLKSGPRKGEIISDPSCYDIADAYVMARAGIEGIN